MEQQEKIITYTEYEDVESFAKLEGPEFKQFIYKTLVFLGRDCNNIEFEDSKEQQIIFIGDSQKISRRHAMIYWNEVIGEWEIQILSKNKAVINGQIIRKGDAPIILKPRSAIKIDKYKFYFFPALPND